MLLEEFSTIFDRPEKVKKLREYILGLAVRGKLVEQDENDEPASILLGRISEEKDRLVKEKKIKKEKPLAEISEDEIPYELPKGWEWSRIGNLITLKGGKRIPKGHEIKTEVTEHIYIRVTDMKNGTIRNTDLRYIDNETFKKIENYIITSDDLYITIAGTIAQVGIVPEAFNNMNLTENAARIIPYIIDKIWLKTFLESGIVQESLLDKVNQMAQPKLALKRINDTLIPLPPLNEQKRIVEKLDYLMEFCDNLEAQLEKKVKYGSLSAKSVLNGVSNCSSYEELEEALRFIIDNFKDLTLADGTVGELKNAILSLAVKGKLVPRDESDEPASALLERIREEKEKLVKDKRIKKEKILPQISEDEIPYELPKGWEWIRMRELAQNIHYGYTASAKTNNTGVKFVRITDIQNNMVNWEAVPYCDIDDKKLESCKLENNDILIARTGGTIGKSFIVENVEYSAVFASYLIRVIPLKSINPRYLKLFLETPLYWRQLISKSQGTGQPNVNAVSLSELVMPLPSINEQERIIDRVEKLMKVCEKLELRIEKSKKYSEKLMESILKNSFKA
ncbi:restriction endonuclease subunit S [Paraclostridium sordellii]|uniref:restriction endonuclease subunit S n=1 Tax=Paraclostridium sordellii TaxID=1505 RepID=UPI0030CB4677